MDAVHEHTLRQEHSKQADGKSKDSSGKVPGASDNGKALLASNDHIVVSAGAVDTTMWSSRERTALQLLQDRAAFRVIDFFRRRNILQIKEPSYILWV